MKICRKCHIEFNTKDCAACKRIYGAKYRAEHPEKRKAIKAKSYLKNKESVTAANLRWRLANPEKVRAFQEKYAIENRDKIIERRRLYYACNAEALRIKNAEYRNLHHDKRKASKAKWASANPERCLMYAHARRARKTKAGGVLTKGLKERLFKLQKGKCPCCKQPLGEDCQLDHIHPISLGGENIDSNIQLLRARCNYQKHARHPVEFMQSRGFLL